MTAEPNVIFDRQERSRPRRIFTRGAIAFLWVVLSGSLLFLSRMVSQWHALELGAATVCLCLVVQIWRKGIAESGPLLLFAATMFVFAWARPLIALTSGAFDLRVIEVLNGIPVSAEGLRVYFAVLEASMVAFCASVVCWQLPKRNDRSHFHQQTRAFTVDALFTWQGLFLVGAAASFLQSILYLRYFLNGGSYYDLYTKGADAVGFPGLSFLASLLFYGYLGILLTLWGRTSPALARRRWAWTIIFLLLSIFGLTRGSRGEVFTQLLAGVWLFSLTRGKAISLRAWGVIGAVLFVLAQLVSDVRAGHLAGRGGQLLLSAVLWFVYTQGLSGELVAPAHAQFGLSPDNIRFLFSPLLGPFRRLLDPSFGSQTVQYGQSSGLLSHELAFRISPTLYLQGHAAGSSYLAETYCSMGLAGVMLATALLVWLVLWGPGLARRSRAALFLFSASLPYILFVPRESLVFPLMPCLKAFAFLFICRRLGSIYVYYRRGADVQPRSAPGSHDPDLSPGTS